MSRRPPATSQRPLPPDPVMYLAAWPVVAAAVICAGRSIESVPGLLNFLLAVVSVGIATSYWLRRIGADRSRVNLTVTGAALVLGVAATVVDQDAVLETVSLRWLMQAGIDGLIVTFLIRGIAWITAFRCFTLLTDLEVVLSLGFSLSLFILVSVIEADAPLLAYFTPFAVGGLDLLLRYHTRSLQQEADRVVGRRVRPWRQEAGSVAALAAGVALGTVLLTVVAGNVEDSGWFDPSGSGLTERVTRWFERLQGLGQDAVQLKQMDIGGRAPAASLDEVLRVQTGEAQLWRGNVFARYDGRIWHPAGNEPAEVIRRGPGRFFVGGPILDLRRSDLVRHRVTYVEPGALLYNARNLVAVDVRPFNVQFTSDGRGVTWPAMPRGTVCRVYCLADSSLDAMQLPLNQLTEAQRRRYLELPDGLPGRVAALARRIVGASPDDGTRMERLASYLSTSKYYTDSPGRIPLEADAVDWFLHQMPSGWCRHFASATAVLGRCVGVPTRLVDGYLPGLLNNQSGEYVVRQRDAHVWCEAWLPDRGWVAYDPTALAELEPAGLSQGLVALQARLDGALQAVQARLPGGQSYAALLALLLVGLVGWQGQRRGWLAILVAARRGAGPAGAAARVERRLHRLLHRLQLSRQPHEPELVFAARAAGRLPAARDDLRAISELLCDGRYRGRPLDDDQLDEAETLLARIGAAVAARGGRTDGRANRWPGGADDGPSDAGRTADLGAQSLAADAGHPGRGVAAPAPDGPADA